MQRLIAFFRARDSGRGRAPGRTRGRSLHAPQGDPPGDGRLLVGRPAQTCAHSSSRICTWGRAAGAAVLEQPEATSCADRRAGGCRPPRSAGRPGRAPSRTPRARAGPGPRRCSRRSGRRSARTGRGADRPRQPRPSPAGGWLPAIRRPPGRRSGSRRRSTCRSGEPLGAARRGARPARGPGRAIQASGCAATCTPRMATTLTAT